MEIKTTFLFSFIKQFVYIEIFKGKKTKADCNIIYKLLKTLYNLEQFFALIQKICKLVF